MKNVSNVRDTKDIIEKNNWKIFGISGLPISRSDLRYFVKDFELIYSINSGEEKSVKNKAKTAFFNIQKCPDTRHPGIVLSDRNVADYIRKNSKGKKVGVYTLKSSLELEKICNKNGWTPICNSKNLFEKIDNRLFFLDILKKINNNRTIRSVKVSEIKNKISVFFEELGDKLVFQLMEGAGGRGIFFIKKGENIDLFIDKIKKRIELLGGDISSVIMVSSFISGNDFGIMACVTEDNGILISNPRYQIIDIPQSVEAKNDGSGVFCGHDWSYSKNFPSKAKKEATELVNKIGQEIKKIGYKGVFGVDFIISDSGEVTPIEINPRLLGSLPVETQIQIDKNEVPLSAFHVLEFLKIKYKIKSKKVYNKGQKGEGAHLMLFNFLGKDVKFKKGIKGGVYTIKKDKLIFLRDGFELCDIKNASKEFVITEAVPTKGFMKEKNRRFCRIIYKKRILGKNTKSLLSSEIKKLNIIKKYFKDKVK